MRKYALGALCLNITAVVTCALAWVIVVFYLILAGIGDESQRFYDAGSRDTLLMAVLNNGFLYA